MSNFISTLDKSLGLLTESAIVVAIGGNDVECSVNRDIHNRSTAQDVLWLFIAEMAERAGMSEDEWRREHRPEVVYRSSIYTRNPRTMVCRVITIQQSNVSYGSRWYVYFIGDDAKLIVSTILHDGDIMAPGFIGRAVDEVYGVACADIVRET